MGVSSWGGRLWVCFCVGVTSQVHMYVLAYDFRLSMRLPLTPPQVHQDPDEGHRHSEWSW